MDKHDWAKYFLEEIAKSISYNQWLVLANKFEGLERHIKDFKATEIKLQECEETVTTLIRMLEIQQHYTKDAFNVKHDREYNEIRMKLKRVGKDNE